MRITMTGQSEHVSAAASMGVPFPFLDVFLEFPVKLQKFFFRAIGGRHANRTRPRDAVGRRQGILRPLKLHVHDVFHGSKIQTEKSKTGMEVIEIEEAIKYNKVTVYSANLKMKREIFQKEDNMRIFLGKVHGPL